MSVGWKNHTCGVKTGGAVVCWGNNSEGRGTPPDGSFISVSAGYDHTCGVQTSGAVTCWGDDYDGQATPPAGSFAYVTAGNDYTCGVERSGRVVCWGRNDDERATPPGWFSPQVSDVIVPPLIGEPRKNADIEPLP